MRNCGPRVWALDGLVGTSLEGSVVGAGWSPGHKTDKVAKGP